MSKSHLDRGMEKKMHLFYWWCIIQPQCLKPFFSVFQWCHLQHAIFVMTPLSVCPPQICDVCDGPTHSHIVSSSGGFTAGRVMVEPLPVFLTAAGCLRARWWHRVTPVPNLCLTHRGRHSRGGDVARCAPVSQSVRDVRSENKTLLQFGCVWVVKGNECLLLQIPWDLSVISRTGAAVWCGGNTCSDAQAFPKDRRVQIKNRNKLL